MNASRYLQAARKVAKSSAQSLLAVQRENALRQIFGEDQLQQIDKWMKANDGAAGDRSEAVRQLVELGLKAKT